jgi:hypothetical protein
MKFNLMKGQKAKNTAYLPEGTVQRRVALQRQGNMVQAATLAV